MDGSSVQSRYELPDRHHLDFAPYTPDELVAIGRAMLADASYYLSDQAETAFREQLTRQIRQPHFANARSVRNDLERAGYGTRIGSPRIRT